MYILFFYIHSVYENNNFKMQKKKKKREKTKYRSIKTDSKLVVIETVIEIVN